MAMPHLHGYSQGGSPPFPKRSIWTVDDVERLPNDGNRYEILHGELLVTPLPSNGHQGLVVRLIVLLSAWCQTHTRWAIRSPGGVLVSATNWFEPDIAVYAAPEFSRLSWRDLPPPRLVVEVLSPSTRRRDRHGKRPVYLAHGVGEVWLVDDATRTVERWTAASEFPETLREIFSWTPDAAYPSMVATADELFGPALSSESTPDQASDED